jgi:hypothetical protein
MNVRKVNPNISALPLIIKPWHKAVVRWSKVDKMYICSFEGPGYKKELFRTKYTLMKKQIENLGFCQYDIKYQNSKKFVNVSVTPSYVNGSICWFLRYGECDVLPTGMRRNLSLEDIRATNSDRRIYAISD